MEDGAMGDDMKLPNGMACGDCAHFKRCEWLISCKPTNKSCDWSPSRFVERETLRGIAASIARHIAESVGQPGVDLEETARTHILDALARVADSERKDCARLALACEQTGDGIADAVTNGWNLACVRISEILSLTPSRQS